MEIKVSREKARERERKNRDFINIVRKREK